MDIEGAPCISSQGSRSQLFHVPGQDDEFYLIVEEGVQDGFVKLVREWMGLGAEMAARNPLMLGPDERFRAAVVTDHDGRSGFQAARLAGVDYSLHVAATMGC